MGQNSQRGAWRRAATAWMVSLATAWLGLVGGAQAAGPAAGGALLPAEVFFRPKQVYSVALSPQGKQLAMLAGFNGARVGLYVVDLQDLSKPRVVAQFGDADIASFHWVSEQRLVLDLEDKQAAYGDRRIGGGLFSVRADGTELRQWIKASHTPLVTQGGGHLKRELLSIYHDLLDVPVDGSDSVIIGKWVFDAIDDVSDILPMRLNLAQGTLESLARGAPDRVFSWRFDPKGRPRYAISEHNGRRQIWQRGVDADATWVKVDDVPSLSSSWAPLWIDAQDKVWVRTRDEQGYQVLSALDPATGRPSAKPLISTPGFDLRGSAVIDPQTRRTLGYHVVTDAETTVWFDPAMAALQKIVDDKLPGLRNRIACNPCTPGQAVVLVSSWSDLEPGRWTLFEQASGRWQSLGASKPEIDPRGSATVDFHRIKARDGLDVPVWVTLPPQAKPGVPNPTVVLVHGGPWVRGGDWRWRPLQQFLASRGYAVIEPEFRGSTGYGRTHFAAGFKQWGQAMQDDVADALQWAVKQGIADGNKACIVGGSYGGYATLMGLVRHPQAYRCGVAYMAVTDVALLAQGRFDSDMPLEFRRFGFPELVGDPKDAELMRSISPVYQAAAIKAPVMLVFGGLDRRVPIEHGDKMRAALRAAGREPVWVRYDGEGHGWGLPANQADFADRLEAFLAEQMR